MDPIEKAIRTALEKGDVENPEFRSRVYRSVEAALDRVIQGNPQMTVEKAIARRRQLQQKIAEIETEFVPARPADSASDDDLDAALLDILENAPGETRMDAGRSAPPAPDFPAAPAGEAPLVELAGRREPGFSEPAFNHETGTGRPEPSLSGDGRFSAAARRAAGEVPAVELGVASADAGHAGRVADVPEPVAPSVDIGVIPSVSGRMEPDLDFPATMPPPLDEPDISAPVPPAPLEVAAADRRARKRERRRPFAAVFFGLTLVALAVVGLLFAVQTGLLKSPAERDTSVPNPPPQLGSEDFDPGSAGPPALGDQPASQQDWIDVFVPADPSTANAPGGTTAEAMQDDSGAFLRIRSGSGDAAVSFDVGQGVLEQLAGRKAVFNITARGEDGQQTEMSIECNFGDLGDCGRKRYEVGYEKGDFLFEITFPDKQPGSSGTIAINSDFSGQGRSIDIYGIRVAAQ
ncbi:MAG: hypothetical protein R3E51_19650 [Rhizobiaceae bacterium]